MINIADLHLGKENDSHIVDGIPVQRRDVLIRLFEIGDLARETGQAIAIAGDIFTKLNPTSVVISAFFNWLSLYPDVNIYLIPGNHDSGVDWINMTMIAKANLSNVFVILEPSEIVVKDSTGTASVVFWPHMTLAQRERIDPKTPSEYIMEMFPKSDLFITHGQVTDSDYTNDIFFEAGDAMPLDLSVLSGLIITGHIHGACTYKSDNAVLTYPGSVTVNNFGEVEESKGYIELNLDSKKWEWHEFADTVTPWRDVEIDLTDKDETQISEDAIKRLAEGSILKITVIAKQYGIVDEAYLRKRFNQYGHVTRFQTKVLENRSTISQESAPSLSHAQLLSEWIDNLSSTAVATKKIARKLGTEIIEEVLQ